MRARLTFALAAVVAIAGCIPFARQAFRTPTVAIKDVRVRALGLEGGSLDLVLDVFNPNEYRMDATRLTYTLVAGAGSTDNALFNISGGQLRANASFDFETKSSYSIRVHTTDLGGLSFERQFTITVTDDPNELTVGIPQSASFVVFRDTAVNGITVCGPGFPPPAPSGSLLRNKGPVRFPCPEIVARCPAR